MLPKPIEHYQDGDMIRHYAIRVGNGPQEIHCDLAEARRAMARAAKSNPASKVFLEVLSGFAEYRVVEFYDGTRPARKPAADVGEKLAPPPPKTGLLARIFA